MGQGGAAAGAVLVHDERNRVLADLLAGMRPPEFPMALGVLYCDPAPTYEEGVFGQVAAAGEGAALGSLFKGPTWVVE